MTLSKNWKTDVLVLIIAFIIGFFFSWIATVVIIIVLFFYNGSKSKSEAQEAGKKYNLRNQVLFESLGTSFEERERNIKHVFEKNSDKITASLFYTVKNGANSFDIWTTISRNLSIMEPREREFLRSTFLLYNKAKITEGEFRYFLFAFTNGNSKATIEDVGWRHNVPAVSNIAATSEAIKYMQDNCFKDNPTTIKFIQTDWDANVDSAITRLLQKLEHSNDVLITDPEHQKLTAGLKNRIYGNGAWLSEEDLPGSIFNTVGETDIILGGLENSTEVLTYAGEGSLITIAPPGSGKTQCLVIPNLLSWKGAAVVLDIKGEIHAATSSWREKHVGKIFKFSPLDPNNSCCYNPLSFIRKHPDYIWEDARFLAEMMIVPSGAADPFWENMARDVLNAAIAYVTFTNDENNRPMSKVIDIIYGIGWDQMITSLRTNPLVSAMRQTGHALGEMEKKQKDSILKTAQSSLSSWQGERIGRVTKTSDWNPLDLRTGTPTIYICINPNEIDSYLSVLRVVIAQHIRMLTTELPKRGTPPALFMLDELPRLKKMPPIDEALSIGRQYGIKLWMFAQSYGQLKEAYTNAEGLLGSCAVRTFMNLPLNDELTTKISEQLGDREGPLDATRHKLVEPLELAGPNYRDIILVLATNTKPAKVRKSFAWQNEALKTKMEPL